MALYPASDLFPSPSLYPGQSRSVPYVHMEPPLGGIELGPRNPTPPNNRTDAIVAAAVAAGSITNSTVAGLVSDAAAAGAVVNQTAGGTVLS